MINFPNAKINLGLNIVRKREDGYHDLETVFYPVPVKDILEIVPAQGDKTTLNVSGNAIDCPMEKNLVMKAYNAMKERYGIGNVDIYLHKAIPDGAGLGGGSADAAFTLKILNELFELKAEDDELAEIASKIGADCPFFIYNTPMKAEGIGNIFSDAEVSLKGYYLALIKPDVYVSTKVAYSNIVPAESEVEITEILKRPLNEWKGALKNDFEKNIFKEFPLLKAIKDDLYEAGAEYACMSGSGSSIFGIFKSVNMADRKSVV